MSSSLIALGVTFVIGISFSVILQYSKPQSQLGKKKVKPQQQPREKPRQPCIGYPRKFTGNLQVFSQTANAWKSAHQSLQDPAKYFLSLVIPAYNEARRLSRMLDDAVPVLQRKAETESSFTAEVILVDDGSKDDTCAQYTKYVSDTAATGKTGLEKITFKLLKLPRNCGKGRAVSEGFLASAGELVLFADADGSTDFAAVNKFQSIIQSAEQSQVATLICGSRAAAQSLAEKKQVKRSFFRWILMKAFHAFISIFGVRSVKDTQCGFKMMNRRAARLVVPWIHISGWIFDVEMILIAEGKGVSVLEVPVPWKEMDGTKLSLAVDSVKMARDLLRIRFNYLSGLWKYK